MFGFLPLTLLLQEELEAATAEIAASKDWIETLQVVVYLLDLVPSS
jgi:hypothetical protein